MFDHHRSFHRSPPRRTSPAIRMLLVVALLSHPLIAAEALREMSPPGLDLAVDRGLLFLQKQQKSDGAFEAEGPPHAMAGLAVLAFLASGHTPDVGRYGLAIRSAVDWLLKQNPEGGYYGRDGGRMYSHCIVTIALAEVYGTETDERQRVRIRIALDKALKAILAAQEVEKDPAAAGGWRYELQSADSDLSVTTWCLLAMRACQNAGLIVPKQRFDRALSFVMRCYRAEQAGFAYLPDKDPSIAMNAAALLNLHLLNESRREEASTAARFIVGRPIVSDTPFWYHSVYSTTLAAYQAGGPAWPIIWKRTCEQLLPAQRKDEGSWPAKPGEPGADSRPGRFYPTAISCLTLSIASRLLPIYQR